MLAAEKSTRGGIEKAISQVTLGGLYFDRHRYDLAQPCYAEAVPQLPDNYPDPPACNAGQTCSTNLLFTLRT